MGQTQHIALGQGQPPIAPRLIGSPVDAGFIVIHRHVKDMFSRHFANTGVVFGQLHAIRMPDIADKQQLISRQGMIGLSPPKLCNFVGQTYVSSLWSLDI